jgi:hypothetical protein
MATFTRVNPNPTTTVDTLYDTLQLRAFRIEAPGVDLESGTIGGKMERLAQEFGTTGAIIEFDADAMVIIGDAHALNSNIVAKRADKVLGGTGALVNYMAENGNLGTVGSGSAVAGTVAAPVTTAIVEVGSVTTLFGLSST